jgi:hypothetical protein
MWGSVDGSPFGKGLSQTHVTIPAVPQKQPLPQNPFDPHNLADIHAAYDQCLRSERVGESEEERLYARCLGYFLTELPIDRGKHMVGAEDIVLCGGKQEAMHGLAKVYKTYHSSLSTLSTLLIFVSV